MIAPDAEERAEIVGALAEAGCPSCRHRPHYHRLGWCMFGDCDCTLSNHEALAPTVARLIEDAETAARRKGAETERALMLIWHQQQVAQATARAERAEAQVERVRAEMMTAADELDAWDGGPSPVLDGLSPGGVVRWALRVALAETETGHQTRSEAPESAEEAVSRVPGPDGVRDAGRRAGAIVDSEGAW